MGITKITKDAKGTVSIENYRGKLRLRWRYQRERYTLNLFSATKENTLLAKQIAFTIERDLVTGTFDQSLDKYRIGNMIKASSSEKTWFIYLKNGP